MSDQETLRSKKDFWFACVDIDVMRDKTLSPTAKFVFSLLCTFAPLEKRACWPSNEKMSEAAGVSVSTIKRAYQELEKRGVITRSSRVDKDGGLTSSYTHIVGHNAPCYEEEGAAMPPQLTDAPTPSSPMSHKRNKMNNIKDSLTGEAELPEPTDSDSACENKKTAITSPNQESLRTNPEEICTPSDAPDIFKQTAELFLYKTGRQGLLWDEISSLRELSASHTPARVQKEIDIICDRFRRQGRSLATLTFMYIAGALKYQQSRRPKHKENSAQHTPLSGITQADIDRLDEGVTPEESARIEAMARERGIL